MRTANVLCLVALQVGIVAVAPAVSLSGALSGYTIDYSGPNPGFAGLFDVTGVGAGSSAAQSMADLINGDDGSNHWNALVGVSPADGNINIDVHFIKDGNGYANPSRVYAGLQATYTGDPSLEWIQMITTTYPSSGHASSPYIDADPGADPFYPYIDHSGTGSTFQDMPDRPKPANPIGDSAPSNTLEWKADLFLVGVSNDAVTDGHKTVTILDGIEWGFRLVPDRVQDTRLPPGSPGGPGGPSSPFDRSIILAAPVPEPTPFVAMALGVPLLLRRRAGRPGR